MRAYQVLLALLASLCLSQNSFAGSLTGGGGGVPLTLFADDCTAITTIGALGQQCVDNQDGRLYTCKSPQLQSNAAQCDHASEWVLNSVTSGEAFGVTSFNSRAGVVVSASGDYNATQVAVAPAGTISSTNVGAALAEIATETQPLDADLTTLASKTITGNGSLVVLGTGTFTSNNCLKTDASGNITDAGAPCGTGSGSSLDADSVENAHLVNMAEGTIKGRISTGTGDPEDLTLAQVASALDATMATQGEIDAHATSTTAHSATATPTASRIVMSNSSAKLDAGWLPLPTASTVGGALATGNCNSTTGKMLGIGTDGLPVCGTDQNTGGGAASQTLQEVCTEDCIITSATSPATAMRVGSVERGLLIYADDTADKVVLATSDSQNLELQLADGYDLNILDSDGSTFANFDEATKAVDFSMALVTKPFASIADAAPTVDSSCAWDTTAHRLKCGENGTSRTIAWTSDVTAPPSLQSVSDVGRTVFNAANIGTAVKIGVDDGDGNCNEASEGCIAFYYDAAVGMITKVIPDGHDYTDIANTFAKIWRYNGTEAMRLDSSTLKFANTWRPVKSVSAEGHEFGGCTHSDAVVASGKNKVNAFTCTDSDSDGFDFDFILPTNWNAGTINVRLGAFSTATGSGNVVLSCSGYAIGDGEPIPTKDTSGEKTVTIALTSTGNYEYATTATPITLNGTSLTGGDHAFMHCDIDASGTSLTTMTMANVRILSTAQVSYTVTQLTE